MDQLPSHHQILIGNEKLMTRHKVNLSHNNLESNIRQLEQTGKSVVIFVIDSVARYLISLEEEHSVKPEAQAVVPGNQWCSILEIGVHLCG